MSSYSTLEVLFERVTYTIKRGKHPTKNGAAGCPPKTYSEICIFPYGICTITGHHAKCRSSCYRMGIPAQRNKDCNREADMERAIGTCFMPSWGVLIRPVRLPVNCIRPWQRTGEPVAGFHDWGFLASLATQESMPPARFRSCSACARKVQSAAEEGMRRMRRGKFSAIVARPLVSAVKRTPYKR